MFPAYPDILDVTPEEHERGDSIISAALDKAFATKALPEILYHYTTPSGFNGILTSGVLRATHVGYTNDATEHLHASEVLKQCIQAYRGNGPSARIVALLDAMERGVVNTTAFNTLPVAISCFCEDGDLLSQWRGYGQGEGGIAIGFEAKKIVATRTTRHSGYVMPVLYHDPEQKLIANQFLADAIAEYERVLNSRTPADLPRHLDDWLSVFAAKATHVTPLFKHRGFSQEMEWRLIRPIWNITEVGFLPKATHLSPYVDVRIGSAREGITDLLPIKEVWFGPSRYQDHALHSCAALFTKLQYPAGILLRRSITPFRSIV